MACPTLFLFHQSPRCAGVCLFLFIYFSLCDYVSACVATVCDVEITFSTPIGCRGQGTDWANVGPPEAVMD